MELLERRDSYNAKYGSPAHVRRDYSPLDLMAAYNAPSRKMQVRINFWPMGMLRRHTKGYGSDKMMKSVSTSGKDPAT